MITIHKDLFSSFYTPLPRETPRAYSACSRTVDFSASNYGEEAARILNVDGGGRRAMPLTGLDRPLKQARDAIGAMKLVALFPSAHSPEGSMSGLYLYFSCLDEAHSLAQELETADGSFWHGIMHRREPDAGNAAYWFRHVGKHPVFPALREEAHRLSFPTGREWDPFVFVEFCESVRKRPGSEEEKLAMEVQLCEWQFLFDYCANIEAAAPVWRAERVD